MRRIKQIIFFSFFSLLAVAQNNVQLTAPSGGLSASVYLRNNYLTMDLTANKDPLLSIQALSFLLEKDIVEGEWKISGQTQSLHDYTWNPVYGERTWITDRYHEYTLLLLSSGNNKQVTFYIRMYDEGMAFRYEFDKLDFWNQVLSDEKTKFLFDKDYKTWVTTNAQGTYSETSLTHVRGQVERPLVVELDKKRYVALGEAGLVNYSRMKLEKATTGTGVQSVLSGEVNLDLAGYISPWRYVMVGESAGELVENNYFLLNLNEPNQIEDVSWIKPGKVFREVTLTTQGAMACIDFAARNRIEYVEFDAGWYGDEYSKESDASAVSVDPKRSEGPLDLHQIIDYANRKGVGIILYVNMNALEKQLDQILPLFQKWGIKGVKYGFVHVGDQQWTSWLHHAVRKAAKYKLMVDIHDEYRPTGYSRTYPNLMTQEGIRGDEESPSLDQTLYTLFIRMIAGAGDYTNCFFAPRVSSEKMGGKAAQLGKAIAIYSPWQFIYWYDRPEGSPRKAGGAGSSETVIKEDKVTDFYKYLPTVWEDSRILEGEIGRYAVVARRSGSDWYIGALNAGEKRSISLTMDFLDGASPYEATLYYQTLADKKNNKVSMRKIDLKQTRLLPLDIEENSGLALHIYKVYK